MEEETFFIKAGSNKFGLTACPFCNNEGKILLPVSNANKFFCFRDELSAREYRISGICQECQDEVFEEGAE